jgi:hypothetical protein
VILVADVLEDLLVRREVEDSPHLPGTEIRPWVVDGDLDLQVAQVGPPVAVFFTRTSALTIGPRAPDKVPRIWPRSGWAQTMAVRAVIAKATVAQAARILSPGPRPWKAGTAAILPPMEATPK